MSEVLATVADVTALMTAFAGFSSNSQMRKSLYWVYPGKGKVYTDLYIISLYNL